MKKAIIALSVLSPLAQAQADEGMWMPQQLPQISKQLKAAGLKLDPKSLTELTEFPMGAIVSLGGCSGSFVSPLGLVATNHHCVYGSLGHNSKPDNDLIANGFLAKKIEEELPASPGSRILVTKEVKNVTSEIIDADVAKLSGKKRYDAIEAGQKKIVAECEKDEGHRCTVSSFYGGLEFYLIKQLEVRDVRLVYAPPAGVGKFGGDTDNWMWPRHTGDFGFYRAYVSKDGKAADYSKNNVPYAPKHVLKLSKTRIKEGDFVMALGYPGRTNRHRLPSEIEFTFDWNYPNFVKNTQEALAIIDTETKNDADAKIKYAGQVAGFNNYLKNRTGMLKSYQDSDMLARKSKEHEGLKAWIKADKKRQEAFGTDIEKIEQLIAKRDEMTRRDFNFVNASPRLLKAATTLYRLANEKIKPDAERKAGYQTRDLALIKSSLTAIERNYDAKVDKALVLNMLKKYSAQPKAERNQAFDNLLGIQDGMTQAQLKEKLEKIYEGSQLGDTKERLAWLERNSDDFKKSKDSFIQAAVALYEDNLKREAQEEELTGNIQQAYAEYMRAKIAYLSSKGQAVYPDANSTLRVTFGRIQGRNPGADGTTWTAFTTANGVLAKATGEGEFNAPKKELELIKAKDFDKYVDPNLKNLPVNYLATLDITGGNSGSAALNSKAEFIGLAFDGTLDSIISDWDFNAANTRSIQVDSRYMLWQMKKVDKAFNLLKEMSAE